MQRIQSKVRLLFLVLQKHCSDFNSGILEFISQDSINCLQTFFGFGETLGLIPYQWNKVNMQLLINSSRVRMIWYICAVIWYTCDTIYGNFVVVSLFTGDSESEVAFEAKAKILLHNGTRTIALGTHYILLAYLHEIPDFLNGLSGVHRAFLRKCIVLLVVEFKEVLMF